MTDLYLFRRQQVEQQNAYHLNVAKELPTYKIETFEISAWAKTENPHTWRHFWCKEHGCICFETYVPRGTNTIEFSAHFGDDLTIRFVSGPTRPPQPKQVSRTEIALIHKDSSK